MFCEDILIHIETVFEELVYNEKNASECLKIKNINMTNIFWDYYTNCI
jgi:hypothetical protein